MFSADAAGAPPAIELLRSLRGIAMDVDGTLTDGGFYWGPNGEEWKRFHFADVMGLSRAMRAGLKLALISGEDSPLVDRYAAKMRIDNVVKGCKAKDQGFRDVVERSGLTLAEFCFMGDDINDLPAMRLAGLAAAPADARPSILRAAGFISSSRGGNGAVRDLVDAILDAQGEGGETPNL